MKNHLNAQDPVVLNDGVRLLKSDFMDLYVQLGYDRTHTSLVWHSIRVSSQGRDLRDKIYKGVQHLQAATFISDMNEEVKQRLKDKIVSNSVSDSQSQKVDENKASSSIDDEQKVSAIRGEKTVKAKKLIADGIVDAKVIAQQSGAAIAYVRTLLYNAKKSSRK